MLIQTSDKIVLAVTCGQPKGIWGRKQVCGYFSLCSADYHNSTSVLFFLKFGPSQRYRPKPRPRPLVWLNHSSAIEGTGSIPNIIIE
jgi:hypothetical protein